MKLYILHVSVTLHCNNFCTSKSADVFEKVTSKFAEIFAKSCASRIVDNKARRASVELVDALGMLPVTRAARHRDSVASNSEM